MTNRINSQDRMNGERSFAVNCSLRRSKARRGFTLVEVLVALAMTGIVMTVMFTMFRTSQRSYSTQDQVAEMQQNLRVAMSFVSRDVRMSGCGMNLMPDLVPDIQTYYDNQDDGGTAAWNLLLPLSPTNSSTSPDSLDIMYGNVKTGEYDASITKGMPDASAVIQVDDNGNFEPGDFVVITDGVTAVLFEVTDVITLTAPEGKLIHNSGLSFYNPPAAFKAFPETSGYGVGSRCYNFGSLTWITYFVDWTDPDHPNLMANRHDGNGNQVVADNIEDLQFHYFMEDGTETEAPPLSKAKEIRAVRITIVARTSKQDREIRSLNPMSIEDHAPAATNDGYRRAVLETVVKLRNAG